MKRIAKEMRQKDINASPLVEALWKHIGVKGSAFGNFVAYQNYECLSQGTRGPSEEGECTEGGRVITLDSVLTSVKMSSKDFLALLGVAHPYKSCLVRLTAPYYLEKDAHGKPSDRRDYEIEVGLAGFESEFRVLNTMGYFPVSHGSSSFVMKVRPFDGVAGVVQYRQFMESAVLLAMRPHFPMGSKLRVDSVCPAHAFGVTFVPQAASSVLLCISYPIDFELRSLPRDVIFPNGMLSHASHHPDNRIKPLYQYSPVTYYLEGKSQGESFWVGKDAVPLHAPKVDYRRLLRGRQIKKTDMNAKMMRQKRKCRSRDREARERSRSRSASASPDRAAAAAAAEMRRKPVHGAQQLMPPPPPPPMGAAPGPHVASGGQPPTGPPPAVAPLALGLAPLLIQPTALAEAALASAQPLEVTNRFAALAPGAPPAPAGPAAASAAASSTHGCAELGDDELMEYDEDETPPQA